MEAHVHRPSGLLQAPDDALGDFEILGGVAARHLDVDLRQGAEVQDLRDDVGGLEIGHDVGKALSDRLAQALGVARHRTVALLQVDEHLPVVVGDEGAVREREVVVVRRQAEIDEDLADLALWNHLAHHSLDLREDLLRRLDSHAGPGAEVQGHLARLDLREVVLAHHREEAGGAGEEQADNGEGGEPAGQNHVQEADIGVVKTGEPRLETVPESAGEAQERAEHPAERPCDPALAGGVVAFAVAVGVLAGDQHVDEHRHEGP